MEKNRRIKTHAPKIPKREEKKEEAKNYFYYKKKRDAFNAKRQGGQPTKQKFNAISHLHDTLGNKKVTELHRSGKLMAMLKMSKPGDRYEREADQVASQVMNTNPGAIHENSKASVAPKIDMTKVNRKKGSTTASQIKNLSGGEKMDGGTKKFFQSRFDGLDLSKVNIHRGRKAHKMANSINARAFTYGNNIVFNKGEYKPGTMQGKKLLAHELTHVAQQTGGTKKKVSPKLKEPSKAKNALTVTNKDRTNALKSFEGRCKANVVAKPEKAKAKGVQKIANSPAPPVKVSQTQGKVVQGWWGKKDKDKDKEEDDKDKDKKPKGIGGFAWWAFKNLLGLIGIDVDQFMGILGKAGEALGAIIKDPKGFFGNLGKAVKGGINNFVGNFKKHLMNGIAGWLFGKLGDAGLQMPDSFDLKGIFSIGMQVLGLTYDNIRTQVVKGLGKGGEEMMSHAESALDVLKTAVTQGPMALWEQLKEHLTGLKDQVFGMVIDWVKTTVITKGITFLISMLNPAGALIQAVQMIIKVVTFFMERWQQIQDFASSVIDSVSLIAKGDLKSAQDGVENSLAKAMPITISFIAKLIGLGGISKRIKKILKKIKKPIDKAIKKVASKIGKKIKNLKIFKAGKKALDKGKKKVEQGKKAIDDAKNKVEKKIDDKTKDMKDKAEKSRADKQKKKEDEVKEKNRKGKDAHEDKKALTEDDKKKHRTYAAEIVQKLKADKGNNAKDFKEFHASKVKLAKDLEGRYQKKLKKGINIDIAIPPLEKDKKDNDVDFKIKIAPNTTEVKGEVECEGDGGKKAKAWMLTNSGINLYNELEITRDSSKDKNLIGYEAKDHKSSGNGIVVGRENNKYIKQVMKDKNFSDEFSALKSKNISDRREHIFGKGEGQSNEDKVKDYKLVYKAAGFNPPEIADNPSDSQVTQYRQSMRKSIVINYKDNIEGLDKEILHGSLTGKVHNKILGEIFEEWVETYTKQITRRPEVIFTNNALIKKRRADGQVINSSTLVEIKSVDNAPSGEQLDQIRDYNTILTKRIPGLMISDSGRSKKSFNSIRYVLSNEEAAAKWEVQLRNILANKLEAIFVGDKKYNGKEDGAEQKVLDKVSGTQGKPEPKVEVKAGAKLSPLEQASGLPVWGELIGRVKAAGLDNAEFKKLCASYVVAMSSGWAQASSLITSTLSDITTYLKGIEASKRRPEESGDRSKNRSTGYGLWSGAKDQAEEHSDETGGVTLEKSITGNLFDGLMFEEKWGDASSYLWNELSRLYASSIEGEVHIHQYRGVRKGSVFQSVEYGEIQEKVERGDIEPVIHLYANWGLVSGIEYGSPVYGNGAKDRKEIEEFRGEASLSKFMTDMWSFGDAVEQSGGFWPDGKGGKTVTVYDKDGNQYTVKEGQKW